MLPDSGVHTFVKSHTSLESSRRSCLGFSLVEVLATLVIISLITGIAAVSFGPLRQKHNLSLATEDLVRQFRLLRIKAILDKTTYQAKINNQVLHYRLKLGNRWEDWQTYQLSNQIQYNMSGTSRFYEKGFVSPKTVTLSDGEYRQQLIVNINGRIRTSELY